LILELRIFYVCNAPVQGCISFCLLTNNIVHDAFVPEFRSMKSPEISIRLVFQPAGNMQQNQTVFCFARCNLFFYAAPDLAAGNPVHQHGTC
jgi:hypothetical protein